jgi:hypothetical protein
MIQTVDIPQVYPFELTYWTLKQVQQVVTRLQFFVTFRTGRKEQCVTARDSLLTSMALEHQCICFQALPFE